MTSPEVGSAYISLIPSARGFAAKLKHELESAIRGIDTTVKVDVDVDRSSVNSSKQSVQGVTSAVSAATGALTGAAGAAAQFGGAMSSGASSAAGPLGMAASAVTGLAAAIVGLGAAGAVGVPALSALAGAAAALPGAFAGAAAAVGTLGLGFSGIADAFKPKAGGGGGGGGEDPASRARRIAGAERGVEAARRGIASATRGLADAQRGLAVAERGVADAVQRSVRAQEAVNRARREAKEDIDDLNRSLRGARLDEESAALAVTEALRELEEARLTGNLPEIQRADLAYRQAQLTLEESKDTTEDLTEAQAEAAKKGVEGSDKVQNALRDQVEAQRAVQDAQEGVLDAQNAVLSANDALKSSYDGLASAQDALAEAQKKMGGGGGGGGIADLVKLAPNAQKFVDAIKDLKPAFEDLRLDVQQRLFAGLDRTVTRLGENWIDPLKVTLGRYADTFNTFFRTLGANLAEPEFITRLQTAAEGARQGLERIGEAVSGPLVTAFGQLAEKSAPFLAALGDEIADLVEEFSNWIDQAGRSGKLQEFFTTAAEAMSDIFTTGKEVGKIIGTIFQILMNGNGKSDKSAIDSFNEGLQAVNRYLQDPANQQAIANFVDDIKTFLADIASIATTTKDVLDRLFGGNAKGDSTSFGEEIGKFLIAGLVSGIVATVKANVLHVVNTIKGIVQNIKDILGIKSPSTVMMKIGAEIVNGLIKGIGDKFVSLVQKVAQIPGRIRAGIGTAASILYSAGQSVVVGLANGALSYYSRLTTWTRSLRGAVTNAFVNAGTWLYNIGRTIVSGLMNGISSMFGRLGSFLGGVGTFIQNNKGPIEKDRKLLIPAGRAIMQGLVEGIADGKSQLGSELGAVTGMFGDIANPTANYNVTAGQPQLMIGFAPTSDPLLRGLRDVIRLQYSGSADAALSTG